MRTAVVTSASEPRRQAIADAIRAAGAEPVFIAGNSYGMLGTIFAGSAPRCFLLDTAVPEAAQMVAATRGDAGLFAVPIVCLVSNASDDVFRAVHSLGADDAIVITDGEAITRRIRRLASFDPAIRAPATRGYAVVLQADEGRRRVVGRVLRQARFDPIFASTKHEARVLVRSAEPIRLMVASSSLCSAAELADLRAMIGPDPVPLVVLVPEQLERSAHPAVANAVTTSDSAPPDDLLFVVNELTTTAAKDARASRRLLLGTLATFRDPGGAEMRVGLTYNVSREGLYIRSLDPPATGTEQWIELRPPWRRPVHLRGTVVWARGPESWDRAAPAGFAVRIDEIACPAADLAEYRAGYDDLLAASEETQRDRSEKPAPGASDSSTNGGVKWHR